MEFNLVKGVIDTHNNANFSVINVYLQIYYLHIVYIFQDAITS